MREGRLSTFVIGREIVSEALRSGDARPYLEAGLTLGFMRDAMHPAYAAVFTGQDIDAWLESFATRERTARFAIELFRRSFPAQSYALTRDPVRLSELVPCRADAIEQFETEVGSSEASRYIDAGDPVTAARIMLETAQRVLMQQAETGIRQVWDDPDYDIDARIRLRISRGPGFGIPALDDQFPGFQPASSSPSWAGPRRARHRT